MLRVVGKGGKERIVPVLPAVREAIAAWLALHPDRQPDSPLFLGARGGRLDAGGGAAHAAALPAAERPAGARDAARAAAFVRDAPAGRRGGPALDPGPAGPCQPVHHAALHRGGRGAAGGGLAQGASAGVTMKGDSDAGIRSRQGAGVRSSAPRREGARPHRRRRCDDRLLGAGTDQSQPSASERDRDLLLRPGRRHDAHARRHGGHHARLVRRPSAGRAA